MIRLIFLPTKDSSDISELRKKELNISRSYARELGKTAAEAINPAFTKIHQVMRYIGVNRFINAENPKKYFSRCKIK